MTCEKKENQRNSHRWMCLWDGVLTYLFIYSHFAAINVFFPWICIPLMHDGRPTQWLLLKLTYLEFVADLLFAKPAFSRRRVLLSFKRFMFKSSLVPFFNLPCWQWTVSERWLIFMKNAWLTLPGFAVARDFSKCINLFIFCLLGTFCCMIDWDLFWLLWKLIVC